MTINNQNATLDAKSEEQFTDSEGMCGEAELKKNSKYIECQGNTNIVRLFNLMPSPNGSISLAARSGFCCGRDSCYFLRLG